MLFQQTAAPTGWTKITTHNDKALRVVNGTVSSGGSDAFSAVFDSSKTTGSHSLTSGENGSHTHSGSFNLGGSVNSGSHAAQDASDTVADGTSQSVSIGSSGSGTGHSHTLTLDLQYVDIILAQKD
jgi:hypothetical protein